MLPCPLACASWSAEELARLTHLRISCAPMPSWSVYRLRVSWMRLFGVRAADHSPVVAASCTECGAAAARQHEPGTTRELTA